MGSSSNFAQLLYSKLQSGFLDSTRRFFCWLSLVIMLYPLARFDDGSNHYPGFQQIAQAHLI